MADNNDDTDFELSRRKILGAAGTVGAASALGGAATSGLLWDEETFGNATDQNILQAGKLDLKVDWEEHYNGEILETSDEFDGPDDETVANAPDLVDQPPPVITLEDVKPGDSGEVTFSLHLFGNPGWISMCGERHASVDNGITEPEDMVTGDTNGSDGTEGGDLADHIRARAWYDIDGDNELDIGGENTEAEPIFASGSLADVLDALNSCQLLDPTVYDDHESSDATGGSGGDSGGGCVELERLEWDDDTDRLAPEDEVSGDDTDGRTVNVITSSGGHGYVTDTEDRGTYEFLINGNFVSEIEITVTEREASGQPRSFDYEVTGGNGLCEVIVKGGSGESDYGYDECTTSDDALTAPINPNNNQPYGVSHIRFFACETTDGEPPAVTGDCFTNSTTYHIGFAWWLPRDIPGVNDNIVQTDRTEFTLSFEAVQCRHNVTEDGEPIDAPGTSGVDGDVTE